MLSKLGAFLRRHKHAEAEAVEAAGMAVAWRLLAATVFGAGVAGAAVLVTETSAVHHPNMALSARGAAFITREEGVRYAPYNDAVGVCTVGVGHVLAYRRCSGTELRMRLDPGQVTALLMADAGSAVGCVHDAVTRAITVPQDDALISFTFNVGCGGLRSSSVLRDVNSGSFASVPGALMLWVNAGGHRLAGLVNRREAEGHLFATGDYGPGIGRYIAPRPVAPAVARLRANTGYFSWLAWYLGEDAWKAYRPHAPSVRPNVPKTIGAAWWKKERAFVKARR